MPKANVPQTSFNSGELSPLMYGDFQAPRYKKGLALCLNYLPTLQGPLIRKPGSKYVNPVKDSTNPPILVPFKFSSTQAYILEFGNGYIRFYANNGQVITSGTTYQVSGSLYYPMGLLPNIPPTAPVVSNSFYAIRTNQQPLAGESIVAAQTNTIANGSIMELQSPYWVGDLALLRWTQNQDVMYFAHPNYPLFKLERFGQQSWRLSQVYLTDGPYLALNSYLNTGDNTGVTMTPAATGSVGAPYAIVNCGPTATVSGMVTDPLGSGQVQVTTSAAHGYTNGQQIFISGVVGTTEANNANPSAGSQATLFLNQPAAWTIQVVDATHFLLLGSTFAHAWTSGGTCAPAIFAASCAQMIAGNYMQDYNRSIALISGGNRYWGNIGSPAFSIQTSGGNPSGFTNPPFPNAASCLVMLGPQGPLAGQAIIFPNTNVATAWMLGAYGGAMQPYKLGGSPTAFVGVGYPSALTFHQNRLVLSGAANVPQEVDGSQTGSNESFAPNNRVGLVQADNYAYQYTLNSSDANPMRWLSSSAWGLLGGSYSGEWVMSPSTQGAALTPSNFNALQSSIFGASNLAPVQLGNATLYIQRSSRKVREMNYFFYVGTFRSTDMTALSEHIALPSLVQLATQQETQPLIWALRSDGIMAVMVYNRDDVSLIAGWARVQLGGQSDSGGTPPMVTSMAVIPDPTATFDQLWLVVKRFINGAITYAVEYMVKSFDDATLIEDSYHFDCGATYDTPIAIQGITNANPAVVTANSHGFSNGNQVKITGVIGLNKKNTDINNNVTTVNGVNEMVFQVGSATANTFQLLDLNTGAVISLAAFGAYVSGGQVRKLVTTISGLTWLKNETISVLTDGGIHPDVVVDNTGAVTLNYAAAKVQLGYKAIAQGQLLRIDAGSPQGTSIGNLRRNHRVAFMLHNQGDLKFGPSFTELMTANFMQADSQQADQPQPLYNGIYRDEIAGQHDFDGALCFQQDSGLPGCIQAVVVFMEEEEPNGRE